MEEKEDAFGSPIRSVFDPGRILEFFLFPYNSSKTRGFTLVELLVVMGVVGVIAASLILVIDPVGQMGRARDSKIKSNMSQIQTALELYRSDCGNYPSSVTPGSPLTSATPTCTGYTGPVINYLQTVPTFPTATAQFNYTPGSTYTMRACLEKDDVQITTTFASCSSTHKKIYQVSSP